MKLQDLRDMDRNDVLALLGLAPKRSAGGRVSSVLATLGIGLLVGAGISLLLAPKRGSELRRDVRAGVERGKGQIADKVRRAKDEIADKFSEPTLPRSV